MPSFATPHASENRPSSPNGDAVAVPTIPARDNAVCSLQPSYPYDILTTSLQETSR
ncbi:MAG: hypothetical protein OJF47_004001 [Nitrospira sp.]|nr:MAG: hypothetical protein OJF47_004001 [Nitrospira sp.]